MRLLSRQFWVLLHRWAGLTLSVFLIIAGFTGAILPFQETLTLASRPELSSAVPPHPGARPLDAVVLAQRIAEQTGAELPFLPLQVPTDHVFVADVAAGPGEPPLSYDTVWADPYDGSIRLRYRYGVLSDGAQNIVPFLYQLHYGFVAGDWGVWAFGVAALVWTLDCFVGFYLTLPIRKRASRPVAGTGRSWWARWRPAWTVRRSARGHKLNFDLHRAGGLWLWPPLLVFAWSGLGFNLPSVRGPIMRTLGAIEYGEPAGQRLAEPTIGLQRAREIGASLMAEQARERGFAIEHEGFLVYSEETGAWRYSARTTLDPAHDLPQTTLWFSATNGALLRFDPPLGNTLADATMSWFDMLHMAQVFGLPYRILVSVIGLGVVLLSVTGILIWTKKRSARLLGRQRRSATGSVPLPGRAGRF